MMRITDIDTIPVLVVFEEERMGLRTKNDPQGTDFLSISASKKAAYPRRYKSVVSGYTHME